MSVIIRLDNLSWNASSLDVRRYFYGLDIPDGGVHIVGGERGTVFIAFATDEDARQAMLKDNGRICGESFKLFLSSKTEILNVIASVRGASGPIHEVFMGQGVGRNVGGPMAQKSEGQQSFSELAERNHENSRRFSPLRPDRLSTHVRRFPDVFSERQSLERSVAYEENRYLKGPLNIDIRGRGRPPFDDARPGNEGIRDQWNLESQKESDPGFQRPDSDRFGDWLRGSREQKREVELRHGSFSNRREPTDKDGPRPSQIDFEQSQSRRDDLRFPPSKGEFCVSSGLRSQNHRPFDLEHFENVHPVKGMREKYPQDTDRRPLGLKDHSYLEQKASEGGISCRNEPRGDWFVYVYNLPHNFNYREVRRFFSNSIIPQDGLKLINDRNGHRTGECYIRLANENGFQAALDCNNTLLSGKTVFVERTTGQEFDDAWDSYIPLTNRSRSRSPLERDGKEKLYYVAVKNLPYKCSEDDLMKWLGVPPLSSESGPYFGFDGTGNKIGKAFLRLNSFMNFKKVLSCNEKDFRGQKVQIHASGERIFHDRRSIAKKWNVSGKRENINADQGLSEGFPGPRNPTAAKDEGKKFYCVRILGLPFTANPQAVKEFFKGLEIANGGIHIVYNRDNQATGFGFVEFVTSTDCRRALERNNQYMGKRYLVLEPVAKDDALLEFDNVQQKYGGTRDDSGNAGPYNSGLDAGSSETVVRMKNLHFKVQLDDILHFFRGHHPIMESIKLQYRDGRQTGDGLISFESFAEAERAVKELNHQKLLGWPLTMALM